MPIHLQKTSESLFRIFLINIIGPLVLVKSPIAQPNICISKSFVRANKFMHFFKSSIIFEK